MPAFPRWVIIVSGFVLIVLAYQIAWPWMQSATGLPGPTVVQAIHPAQAVVALLAATMVGGVIAMTISKLITGLSGLVVMGAALGWAGLSLAPMRDVLYHGSAAIVAVDGVAWCIVLLILSWIAIVLCSPVPDVHPEVDGAPSDPLRSPNGLKMLAAGVAALPVVWLVAQSDFRGQTLAATVLGGGGCRIRWSFVVTQRAACPAALGCHACWNPCLLGGGHAASGRNRPGLYHRRYPESASACSHRLGGGRLVRLANRIPLGRELSQARV